MTRSERQAHLSYRAALHGRDGAAVFRAGPAVADLPVRFRRQGRPPRARIADGYICMQPNQDFVRLCREAGAGERAVQGGLKGGLMLAGGLRAASSRLSSWETSRASGTLGDVSTAPARNLGAWTKPNVTWARADLVLRHETQTGNGGRPRSPTSLHGISCFSTQGLGRRWPRFEEPRTRTTGGQDVAGDKSTRGKGLL
jgi:hypothetical protein